jgi:hypothetical protein
MALIRWTFIVALFFPFCFIQAAEPACEITIRTTLKSGTFKKLVLKSSATTEAQCAKHASDHEVNFYPPKVLKTEVSYQFGLQQSDEESR